MSDTFIALDPSTTCTGFAVFYKGEYHTSGYIRSTKRKDRPELIDRITYLVNTIKDIIDTYKKEFDLEFIEVIKEAQPKQFSGGVSSINMISTSKLHGILEYAFFIEKEIYPISVNKTFQVPKGTRGKEKKKFIQEKINYMYYTEITNLDESDAIAVGLTYLRKIEEENEQC